MTNTPKSVFSFEEDLSQPLAILGRMVFTPRTEAVSGQDYYGVCVAAVEIGSETRIYAFYARNESDAKLFYHDQSHQGLHSIYPNILGFLHLERVRVVGDFAASKSVPGVKEKLEGILHDYPRSLEVKIHVL